MFLDVYIGFDEGDDPDFRWDGYMIHKRQSEFFPDGSKLSDSIVKLSK